MQKSHMQRNEICMLRRHPHSHCSKEPWNRIHEVVDGWIDTENMVYTQQNIITAQKKNESLSWSGLGDRKLNEISRVPKTFLASAAQIQNWQRKTGTTRFHFYAEMKMLISQKQKENSDDQRLRSLEGRGRRMADGTDV